MTTPTEQRKPPPTPPPAGGNGRGASPDPFDLDRPLVDFTEADHWTTRDACEGVQVFGAIGSGKTSGSGATLARAYLRAGFGGVVMCAKPEERRLWEDYARECGRAGSLIVIEPPPPDDDQKPDDEKAPRFNFLDYELHRTGAGSGITENVVNLLTHVIQIAEGKQEQTGGESQFFERAAREMLRNAVELVNLSGEPLTLDNITRLIAEAPTSPRQLTDDDYAKSSYYVACVRKAGEKKKSARGAHDLTTAARYFENIFTNLGDRTRGSIVTTFSSVADVLLHGLAWDLLCTETTITPEITYTHGAIVILDLPLQEYHELGRIVQGIFKYQFQKAILRRDTRKHPRPVFLWADESQNFVSPFDYQYQAVARSARACTVYLTQNISNYYAALGEQGKAQADALMGNFQTKIYHANSDAATNAHAADIIGEAWQYASSGGGSTGQQGQGINYGFNEGIHKQVLPAEFTTLRKGGEANGLEVEGIVLQGGRTWSNGKTFLKTIFKQRR